MPRAALVNAGLRTADFQSITNARNVAVIAAVRSGLFDAGVAELDDYRNATNRGASFKLLHELNCPNYPWLAGKNLDPKVAETIRKRFLSRRDSDALAPFDPKLTRFESVRPSDYDALEKQMEKAKLFDHPR